MSVSLEKIDMLMERANISYKEAKDALERHDGDMVEALIELESSQKTNYNKQKKAQGERRKQAPRRDFFDDVSAFIKKMHKTSFTIGKKGHKVLDLPLTIASLIILFTLPVSLIILLIPLLLGYKFILIDEKGKKVNFGETFSESKGAPQEEEVKVEQEEVDRRA